MALPEEKPWHPFRSQEDFTFAELVHAAALNRSQVDALVKLITLGTNTSLLIR